MKVTEAVKATFNSIEATLDRIGTTVGSINAKLDVLLKLVRS